MRHRPAPATATWFLKLFCSSAEQESVIGDLLEQYQLGRGRFWYWRQALAIVFLGLYGKVVRPPLVPTNKGSIRHVAGVLLFIAALSTVLLSDISILLMFAVFGVLGGVLVFGLGAARTEFVNSARPGPVQIHVARPIPDAMKPHPGISLSHIPVEGAVGFLFVLATVFIFSVGIPAARELLVVTAPLGILVSVFLIYWHKRHPREIQTLDLNKHK